MNLEEEEMVDDLQDQLHRAEEALAEAKLASATNAQMYEAELSIVHANWSLAEGILKSIADKMSDFSLGVFISVVTYDIMTKCHSESERDAKMKVLIDLQNEGKPQAEIYMRALQLRTEMYTQTTTFEEEPSNEG